MADAELTFDFNEDVIDELINGDCWALAAVLHYHTGWPFAALYGDGEIVHVGVELAGDLVVDVEGIWDSGSWETHWVDKLEDEVWEVNLGFIPDDSEDMEALKYDPMLESVVIGDTTLGKIAGDIITKVYEFQEKNF